MTPSELEYARKIDLFSNKKIWREEAHRALSCLDLNSSHRLLDFGCGTGAMAYVAKRHWGVKYIGIETNKALSRIAKAHLMMGYRIVPSMEFVYEPFHGAIFHHSLAHVDDPVDVLKKVSAKISIAGKVVIVTPNSLYSRMMAPYNTLTGYQGDHTTKHFFDEGSLQETISLAGLKSNKVFYMGDLPKFLPFLPDRFRYRLVMVCSKGD